MNEDVSSSVFTRIPFFLFSSFHLVEACLENLSKVSHFYFILFYQLKAGINTNSKGTTVIISQFNIAILSKDR